jgi:glycosyltransferase involved in cell wall biosynthesis
MRGDYCALIRTFNSAQTLSATLASLSRQTRPPTGIIIVDSGSIDDTLASLPANATIHRYVGDTFNYSDSLNQGLAFAVERYVLVISSHTVLENPEAMELALDLLDEGDTFAAAYFCHDDGPLRHTTIDRTNFNGFNGVWNTCGLYNASMLRRRGFRPEVFSAEDQEWSKWLLENTHLAIARISGGGMTTSNPRGYPLRKRLNENIAIALFVRPDMLSAPYLLRIVYRIVASIPDAEAVRFNCHLLYNLIGCIFRKPEIASRYF